jgi:anaerobic magnesium-protoporphyrin IX monomethyl ester cyclase
MPDILLTHGYFLRDDEKEQKIMKPYPPLGLLYLSAYLRRAGFSVEVFDATFATRASLLDRLSAGPGGVLGIYTNLITRAAVVDIARHAKRHGWTVVSGGPESANYPTEYLEHGADVIVVGEGEETVAELLPALTSRGPHRLHGVHGTIFRDETGKLVTNPTRAQIANLDALPWPDREQIDIAAYVSVWREHHGMGSVNLISSRGCPYRCRWCSHAVYGYTHRRRSVHDTANELQHIVERYNPDMVWYSDDVFTIHHGWVFEYARELQRRGLRVPFETISRADRLKPSTMRGVDADALFRTLAELGCWRLWIGSESGSQRLLDAMQRDVTVEEVQWATKTAQRYGIQIGMFLMWGYADENEADIEATLEHLKAASPDTFVTTVSYPIKGTPYFADVAERVVGDGAWAERTDRMFRIRGRHSRGYYAQADAWVRASFEAHRLERVDPVRAAEHRQQAHEARARMRQIAAEVEA